jgi:hypothetical protein
MNAPQDAWASPLAIKMIGRYRSQALAYIKVALGNYDEETGEIPVTETTYEAAGAVVRSRKRESDGVRQSHQVEAWVDHETVPWPISCNDALLYLGRRWKVLEIESYGSGGDGEIIGPVYITTLDGKIITTLDGKALIVNGPSGATAEYTMYASRVLARAE